MKHAQWYDRFEATYKNQIDCINTAIPLIKNEPHRAHIFHAIFGVTKANSINLVDMNRSVEELAPFCKSYIDSLPRGGSLSAAKSLDKYKMTHVELQKKIKLALQHEEEKDEQSSTMELLVTPASDRDRLKLKLANEADEVNMQAMRQNFKRDIIKNAISNSSTNAVGKTEFAEIAKETVTKFVNSTKQ